MLRAAVIGVLGLGACASVPSETAEAARTECQAQGIPEGAAMDRCVTQMEDAVRAARENGGAPPVRRGPDTTPPRPPRR